MIDIIGKKVKETLALNQQLRKKYGEKAFFFSLVRHINTSPNAKVYLVGFDIEDALPLFFVKIARYDSGNFFLTKTHENLVWLKSHPDLQALRSSFPQPIFCRQIQNRYVQVESYLDGASSREFIMKYGPAKWAALANNWLIDFHQRTAKKVSLTAQLIDEVFLHSLHSVSTLFDKDLKVLEFLKEIEMKWKEQIGVQFSLVCTHNNFSLRNIKINGDELRVFDWENAQPQGLPFLDLIHLFFSYSLFLTNNNFAESLKWIFQGRIEKDFAGHLQSYQKALGLKTDYIQLLLIQFLLFKLLNVRSYRSDLLKVLGEIARGKVSWKKNFVLCAKNC